MRMRNIVTIGSVLALVGTGGLALAAYNVPFKAKKMKMDLAVAYECTAPNATQFFAGAGIIAACNPPAPATDSNPTNKTTFGPKGAANVSLSVAKGDMKVAVKASDVQNNGVAANSINLGSQATDVIATSSNCAPGTPPQAMPTGIDCTSQDIGALFSAILAVPCTAGKCQLKTSINTIAPGAITAGGMVNITLGQIGLTDPDGDLAFATGVFIP
jgi:hypothetical protein